MTPKILGKKLARQRESAELSQGGLAKLAGYASGQIISNAERGTQAPSPRGLKALDKFCSLDVDATVDMMGEIYKDNLRTKIKAVKI